MRPAIFVLVGLIMSGSVRAQDNRITVRGLSQRLQLTGWQTTWTIQGEISAHPPTAWRENPGRCPRS